MRMYRTIRFYNRVGVTKGNPNFEREKFKLYANMTFPILQETTLRI